jgi:hypothetical protein
MGRKYLTERMTMYFIESPENLVGTKGNDITAILGIANILDSEGESPAADFLWGSLARTANDDSVNQSIRDACSYLCNLQVHREQSPKEEAYAGARSLSAHPHPEVRRYGQEWLNLLPEVVGERN